MKKHKVMKKLSLTWLLASVLLALAMPALTSCGDDDYYSPGGGSNSFYDTRLVGIWELTQYNSQAVTQYDTNYLDFYGSGNGEYYYYSNNQPESESMSYYCQVSGSSTTNYQINVQYGNGSPTSMAYWFTDDGASLWLQWVANNETQTYIYKKISAAPW